MSAELAYQKADKHLCVELHRKVRIRLHPSMESNWGIGNRNLCGLLSYQEERPLFFLIYVHKSSNSRFFDYICTRNAQCWARITKTDMDIQKKMQTSEQ